MMRWLQNKSLIAVIILLGTLAVVRPIFAGFGISPPYVKNQQLVPGSKYEQQIVLLRSSAEDDLKATIKVNAPDIASWIVLNQGEEFVLPKGQVQVPMTVTVTVPPNAPLGNYKGSLNIRISSLKENAGGVAIALGARADIDLTVTNIDFADFMVRKVDIPNFEILKWPWNLSIFSHFLHRATVVMNVENLGNVKIAPSKVTLEIYDISKTRLLESGSDTSIDKIAPFSVAETQAHFQTKLGVGEYWGRVNVYKDSTIMNTYDLAFVIAKPGELKGSGLSLGIYPWLLLLGYLSIFIIILASLLKIKIWRYIWRLVVIIANILLIPVRPIVTKLADWLEIAKDAFWDWVGSKANSRQGRGTRRRK